MDVRVGDNHHNISVGCERVNEGREARVANLHPLELRLRFATRKFKLFDNVGNLN